MRRRNRFGWLDFHQNRDFFIKVQKPFWEPVIPPFFLEWFSARCSLRQWYEFKNCSETFVRIDSWTYNCGNSLCKQSQWKCAPVTHMHRKTHKKRFPKLHACENNFLLLNNGNFHLCHFYPHNTVIIQGRSFTLVCCPWIPFTLVLYNI